MAKIIQESRAVSLCRTRPTMIITTLHENGVVNAATFGSYTNLGPQEIGVAIGRGGHTYRNIKREGQFVINIPTHGQIAALEICGSNTPETESELDKAGLTTSPPIKIRVPVITECVANVECEFWKEVEIGHHIFVMGKALCGHLEEEFQDKDGAIDVVKARVPFNIRYPEPLYSILGQPQSAGT